jgi:hypothetical protein
MGTFDFGMNRRDRHPVVERHHADMDARAQR